MPDWTTMWRWRRRCIKHCRQHPLSKQDDDDRRYSEKWKITFVCRCLKGCSEKEKLFVAWLDFLNGKKMSYFLFAEEILKKGENSSFVPWWDSQKGKTDNHTDRLAAWPEEITFWMRSDGADGRWQWQQGTALNGLDVRNWFLGTFCVWTAAYSIKYSVKACIWQDNNSGTVEWCRLEKGLSVHYMNYSL